MTDQHLLLLAADLLDDLERTRIATDNRLRSLAAFGLDGTPEHTALSAVAAGLSTLEHAATLSLQRVMRDHPLAGWVATTRGVGLKSAARLLAVIGDPYWNTLHDRPRTVSELWAFCGLHVVPAQTTGGRLDQRCADAHFTCDEAVPGAAPRRVKGQRANWSTKAKTRAYVVALSCVKQTTPGCTSSRIDAPDGHVLHIVDCRCSPYRVAYDDRRRHTAVTRPDWTAAHHHNDAMRITAKTILRDLWCLARAQVATTEEVAA